MDDREADTPGNSRAGEGASFDPRAMLDRLGGDVELLQILAEEFRSEAKAKIEAIRGSIDAGDARGLEAEAHGFKGSISLLDAGKAYQLARDLELLGGRGDLSGARRMLRLLEKQIQVLLPALETLAETLCTD